MLHWSSGVQHMSNICCSENLHLHSPTRAVLACSLIDNCSQPARSALRMRNKSCTPICSLLNRTSACEVHARYYASLHRPECASKASPTWQAIGSTKTTCYESQVHSIGSDATCCEIEKHQQSTGKAHVKLRTSWCARAWHFSWHGIVSCEGAKCSLQQ